MLALSDILHYYYVFHKLQRFTHELIFSLRCLDLCDPWH